MESRVYLSATATLLTVLVIGFLILGCVAAYRSEIFAIMMIVTLALLTVSMFYAPMSISVNEKEVAVHSPFKIHTIPIRRIVNCELFRPTMGSIRVCGSGGFMGYWGIFREGDVGRYMAYYGNGTDCFIIRLDNGDKYVLGCKNPAAMVAYINGRIRK